MAKVISYQFVSCEVNNGTEEEPILEKIILGKSITCSTQETFDAAYRVATKEALPGTLDVSGEFDEEPTTPEERIAELEEALEMLLNGVTE